MKLGKIINGELSIIEVESEDIQKYLMDGYECIAEVDKPSEDATCSYERVSNGWVQVWTEAVDEPVDEDGLLLRYVNEKTGGNYPDLGEVVKDFVNN